jgi:hypothetical protein
MDGTGFETNGEKYEGDSVYQGDCINQSSWETSSVSLLSGRKVVGQEIPEGDEEWRNDRKSVLLNDERQCYPF